MTRHEWIKAAVPVARRWLRARKGAPFLAEDLLPIVREKAGDPPDARNTGPLMAHLKGMGLISPIAYRRAKTSHGSLKRRWAPLIGGRP